MSLAPLIGQSGSISTHKVSVSGIDEQDHMIFGGVTDTGKALDEQVVERLFELPCELTPNGAISIPPPLKNVVDSREMDLLEQLKAQKAEWFAEESQKLEKWAEDKIAAAEKELSDVKVQARDLKREMRSATDPMDQHRIQTRIQELEKSKRRLRQRIFEVEDEILEKRDGMIADIERRLQQDINTQEIFTIRWSVI